MQDKRKTSYMMVDQGAIDDLLDQEQLENS
jgi:hypothetical protein